MKQESKIRRIINSLATNQNIIVVTVSQENFLLGNMPKEGPFVNTYFLNKNVEIGKVISDVSGSNANHEIRIEVAPKENYIYTQEELNICLDKLVSDLNIKPDAYPFSLYKNDKPFNIKKIGTWSELELGKVLYKENIGKRSIDYLVKFITSDPELENLDRNNNSKGEKEIIKSYHEEREIFRHIILTLFPDPLLAAIHAFSFNIELERLEKYKEVIANKKKCEEEIILDLAKIWPSSEFSVLVNSIKYPANKEYFDMRYGPFLKKMIKK